MKPVFSEYTIKDKNLIINELGSSYSEGLSLAEVLKRQKTFGLNEIKKKGLGIGTFVWFKTVAFASFLTRTS